MIVNCQIISRVDNVSRQTIRKTCGKEGIRMSSTTTNNDMMSFPEDMEFGNLTINVSTGKSCQISVFATNFMYVTYHADVFVPQRNVNHFPW